MVDSTQVEQADDVDVACCGGARDRDAEAALLARVLREVLCGNFDTVLRSEMHTPAGHVWVQDGLYVTCITKDEHKAMGPDGPPLLAQALTLSGASRRPHASRSQR